MYSDLTSNDVTIVIKKNLIGIVVQALSLLQ